MRAKAARALTALLLVGLIGLLIPVVGTVRNTHAAAPPPRVLRGQTPVVVVDGSAVSRAPQDPATPLTLNIGLAAHDSAVLDALIAAVSDPASPSYGHYLTPAQYMARFAPTDAEVAAVRAWAATAGLQVGAVSTGPSAGDGARDDRGCRAGSRRAYQHVRPARACVPSE